MKKSSVSYRIRVNLKPFLRMGRTDRRFTFFQVNSYQTPSQFPILSPSLFIPMGVVTQKRAFDWQHPPPPQWVPSLLAPAEGFWGTDLVLLPGIQKDLDRGLPSSISWISHHLPSALPAALRPHTRPHLHSVHSPSHPSFSFVTPQNKSPFFGMGGWGNQESLPREQWSSLQQPFCCCENHNCH